MEKDTLTPEQKIDEIYEVLMYQERLRRRAMWWGLFRRIVVYGLLIFVILNPMLVAGKILEILKPVITDMVWQIVEEQKSSIMEKVKGVLPEGY